jgi:iron complex outermembrane recepter protein
MTKTVVSVLMTSVASATLISEPFIASSASAQDSAAAAAQATTPPSDGDIVVTASKRVASTVQDTPIAVQALSGADLKAKGALDFSDYFHSIAGLSAQDEGPGDKRYVIRGVNSSGAGTVGLYLDEVIVTGENSQDGSGQAPDIKLFDIDRVEVLKGPQGTTFGSSALAGTIRYITAKPKLDGVDGYVQSSLRATDGASLGYQTDGAINLPVVKDVFAIRASGYYANLPGWIDNRFKKGANNEEDKAFRLEARWKITDDLTLDGMAMYQKVHQDAKSFYNDFGYDGVALPHYTQADYAKAPYDDKSQLYNATLTYKQPWGTFTATGSRFVRDTNFVRDASLAAQAFGVATDYATDGASVLKQDKHRVVDSAEARFASSFDGPLQILAGGFLQNESRAFESSWPKVDAQGNIPVDPSMLLDRAVDTSIHERAIFGEISYQFTPRLTGTAGARLFDIKLRQQAASLVGFGGGAGSGLGAVFRSKDHGVIGRFNLAYKMSDQVNTYIQVAQGYRPGGTNDTTAAEIAHVTIPEGYGSDSLWNYELGVKTSLLDRKLFFDTAIYYIDWSHIQTSNQATDGTVSFGYTGNGGKASVKGVEVTIDYRPIRRLQINVAGNYSLAELDRDNPDPSTGLKGNRVPYVPKWTASAGATYNFPVAALGVNGTIGGDVSYQGSMATKFNSTIDNYHKLDSYTLVNLRAGISKDQWSLTLIANNVFNDRTVTNYNEIVPGVYPDGYYTNRPRTVTLSASLKF